jgi:hypothetical protein
MPQKVYNQIQYLCQQIAKVEWSGILFYKTEGSIQDPSSFKITLMESKTKVAFNNNFKISTLSFSFIYIRPITLHLLYFNYPDYT